MIPVLSVSLFSPLVVVLVSRFLEVSGTNFRHTLRSVPFCFLLGNADIYSMARVDFQVFACAISQFRFIMFDWIMNFCGFARTFLVCVHCILHSFLVGRFYSRSQDFWYVGSMEVAIRLDNFYLVDRHFF